MGQNVLIQLRLETNALIELVALKTSQLLEA